MNGWKNFITIGCLLMFSVGIYQSADAQENLAQQPYAIFEQSCLNCHGEHGAFTEEIIIDHTALIETGVVVPGKPIESELYRRLITEDEAKRMPQAQPRLPGAAIVAIGNWIQAGAPDWTDTSERDGSFITPKKMLETIEKHVNSLPPFDRAFTRYFTLTHLYNAGESAEALHAYQRALSKLVNSLSWGREVIRPQPIDLEETIFYIDLRDYEWEIGTNRWTLIEQVYPYGIEFDAPTQTSLREKLTNLREAMDCDVPFVHVDWFIATAALPPLYHDILDLPQTDRELEARLEVNVVENIRNAAGRRVWRAGFNESGVSNNNRVVERHISRYGAYWKSYDFAGSSGAQNILTHPLNFTHDGGEIIFNLPNGLQAYLLVDAGGRRLNEAPIQIVRNLAASDPTVRNGLSCIGCHTEGMKRFKDEVRAVAEQNPNPPFDKDKVLRLYVDKATIVLLVAVYESGGEFSGYFGFEPNTEYTVVSPGTGFTFSTDTTSVRVGDTFTLRIDAEKVMDLAGWQFDLTFDPSVLEVVKVNEGDFLKKGGGTTFFQRGTIDNAGGKITGLSSALIAKSGVTGTGILLSVVFSAKADGSSELALRNFQLGSNTGAVIPAGVRDLTIIVESGPTWDVNADGQVSVLDLILVAQQMGETASANSKIDVNRDGVVSILDLILVAQHMGESTGAASPSMLVMNNIENLDPAIIQSWIEQAYVEDDGSVAFREGIAYLQSLLTLFIPEETALLPNYPNPFNPETWIPYQLSEPAEVTLRIYAVNGELVRTLALGQIPAGIYQSRSRAAYWDGKNDVGESVASGIYFYTLTAGDFIATRKLLVRK